MDTISKSHFLSLLRLAIVLYRKNCSALQETARTESGKMQAALEAVTQLNISSYHDVQEITAAVVIKIAQHETDVLLVFAESERAWEAILSKRLII